MIGIFNVTNERVLVVDLVYPQVLVTIATLIATCWHILTYVDPHKGQILPYLGSV